MRNREGRRLQRGLLNAVAVCSLGLVPVVAGAQQLSGIKLNPARPGVGEPIQITLTFEQGVINSGCGVRVDLGDGTARDLRVEETGAPVTFTHTYTKDGDFTISAQGDLYPRGLRTVLACGGAERRAQIKVVDLTAERQRQQQEQARVKAERDSKLARQRAEREADETEVALAKERARREAAERKLKAQEQALREREAELKKVAEQRERELAERAEALRRRELEIAGKYEDMRVRDEAARRQSAKGSQNQKGTSQSASSAPSQKAPERTTAAASKGDRNTVNAAKEPASASVGSTSRSSSNATATAPAKAPATASTTEPPAKQASAPAPAPVEKPQQAKAPEKAAPASTGGSARGTLDAF